MKFAEVIDARPKTQTELKRRVRSLTYSDASLSVAWLNAAKNTAAYRRVLAIHQELENLTSIMDRFKAKRRAQSMAFREAKTPEQRFQWALAEAQKTEDMDDYGKFRERHNTLNETLARYAFVPALDYSFETLIWRFSVIPRTGRGLTVTFENGYGQAVRVDEGTTISALARLTADGQLYKVRMCEICKKKWIYAERRMDRFCSQTCRNTFHVHSPDYADRKAANQREYRRRLKAAEATGQSFK